MRAISLAYSHHWGHEHPLRSPLLLLEEPPAKEEKLVRGSKLLLKKYLFLSCLSRSLNSVLLFYISVFIYLFTVLGLSCGMRPSCGMWNPT